ncbi:MAG: endopeptidase La, partial [Lachnospiraceae bacterium]|nr:endopeptidase La [Lachnospiraceae bacterium]
MEDMIKSLPVIPLRGLTVFPTMVLSFDISRERSIRAVEEAMATDQAIFLVTQLDPDDTNPGLQNLYEIGVVANVLSVAKLPKDILRVRVEGVERGRLLEADEQDSYLRAQVQVLKDSPVEIDEITGEAMTRGLEDLLTRYGQINQKFGKDMLRQLLEIHQTEELTTAACVHLPVHYEERQRLLETDDLTERYNLLCTVLVREIEILQVQTDIQQKVKARVDKNQREYVLREQIKVIQEELGEDTLLSDVKHYEEAAAELQASDEVRNKIIKESERLKSIGMNSAENSVLRGYIETLLELPWDKASVDSHDLKHARKILDQDHYGLEKVKERVLEFLAVRCLTEKGDSPIICLVGPPGTGKTSIAQSIARALDKKFVRISLGGVRDEAEIRGHRRTYVGAMPGRIVDGLRQAGVKNPLMLLDEIDKVSSDYRGDTSSALLEVLDSEQNYRFRDNYVELPIDLSGVLFIATANDVHTIPRPLLDRMEIIEVTSYTANEKFHIAQEHLLKKQMAHNGLKKGQLTISKSAMASLIDGYTREAGVRQLERRLGELCRKAAREILEDGASSVRITEKNLVKYLGRKHSQILK